MGIAYGLFALLTMGVIGVVFIARVAREGGRDPVLWGLLSVLVMASISAVCVSAEPLVRSRGSAIMMVWMFGGIASQFLGLGVLYLVLHALEGKASSRVEARIDVFLMDRPGEQVDTSELVFEKDALEVHVSGNANPKAIAYTDIRAAAPDGEVVRISWQTGSTAPQHLTFMLADEELSPRARRGHGISIAAKLMRLAQITPSP